jgi:hypothetical protein
MRYLLLLLLTACNGDEFRARPELRFELASERTTCDEHPLELDWCLSMAGPIAACSANSFEPLARIAVHIQAADDGEVVTIVERYEVTAVSGSPLCNGERVWVGR